MLRRLVPTLILLSVLPLAAQGLPPVERQADAFFELLRTGDDAAIASFVASRFHPSFLEMAPVEVHVGQLKQMREALGTFEVDGIRISGPDRGEFILRAGDGSRQQLNFEVEPIEPFRIVGLGLQPYDADLEIPEFDSLDAVSDWLADLAAKDKGSGVVLVARKGQPDWVRTFGLADRERKIAIEPDTRFDVGSITKALTSVSVMQLVEQGKIDLEAPMSRYLKGFPPEIADKVRVIDLLRMESGYGDYFTPEFEKRRLSMRRVGDFLDFFKTMSLEFEPGTRKRYSNVGYVILGGIVEAVSGMPYADYVRKHVYAPAGMTESGFRDIGSDDPKAAIGYTRDLGDGLQSNRGLLSPNGSPAGGSFSAARDLVRFVRALRGGRLLGDEAARRVLSLFEPAREGAPVYGVAGGAPGISAVLLDDAERGVTVVVLSNRDEPFAERVGQAIFGLQPGEAPRYRVGVMLGVGPDGIAVEGTVPGSPAEKAGLQAGDRLIAVDGRPITDIPGPELGSALAHEGEVVLEVERDGERIEVTVHPERVSG